MEADVPQHKPVLLKHVLEYLRVPSPRVFVDGTVGAGGHSRALLERHPELELVAIDRDPAALEIARMQLASFSDRANFICDRFSNFGQVMDRYDHPRADLLLFDIGVSSMQLDNAERGFSFRFDAPLDMRMGDEGETALDLMQRLEEDELANIIYRYGEERLSRRIAKQIKIALGENRLATTSDLKDICYHCYPRRHHRVDPSTRTFQALRIAVNNELEELETMLSEAPRRVRSGGRLGVITFHSLEDRIVKHQFIKWKEEKRVKILTKKPIRADDEELALNARARSAKFRVCEWLENSCD